MSRTPNPQQPAKPRQKKCPKCGTKFRFASVESFPSYPFCSERCRLIDLGSWLNEEYRVVEDVSRDMEGIDELIDAFEEDQADGAW